MRGLVAAEWLKLRATRAFWVLVGFAFLPALVFGILFALVLEQIDVADAEDVLLLLSVSSFGAVLAIVIGIIASAGEARRNTDTRTYLAAPVRWRVLAAKAVVCAAVAAALSIVSMLLIAVFLLPTVTSLDGASVGVGAVLETVGANVAYWVLLTLMGIGLGAIVRSPVIAIVVLLVLFFVVEPTLLGLAPETAAWFPGVATSAITPGVEQFEEELAAGVAALVSVLYAAALLLAGALVTERRDIS